MDLKKVNDFFWISLSIMGILKVILILLILVQSGTAATAMVTGGEQTEFSFSSFSRILGYGQIALAVCSVVMIIANIKKHPETIMGYIIGLLALVLEVILPSIVYFIYVFIECALYIQAGNIIRNKKLKLFSIEDDSGAKVESTDWFYNDKK